MQRLVAFLRDEDHAAAERTMALVLDGIKLLGAHPLIGRPLKQDRRELVIFRGKSGYLVQYHHDAMQDEVLILAIRHQREIDPEAG